MCCVGLWGPRPGPSSLSSSRHLLGGVASSDGTAGSQAQARVLLACLLVAPCTQWFCAWGRRTCQTHPVPSDHPPSRPWALCVLPWLCTGLHGARVSVLDKTHRAPLLLPSAIKVQGAGCCVPEGRGGCGMKEDATRLDALDPAGRGGGGRLSFLSSPPGDAAV